MRVRICPKYSATVAFSLQEDKDGKIKTNKQIDKGQLSQHPYQSFGCSEDM